MNILKKSKRRGSCQIEFINNLVIIQEMALQRNSIQNIYDNLIEYDLIHMSYSTFYKMFQKDDVLKNILNYHTKTAILG
jgi:hypothetical protein